MKKILLIAAFALFFAVGAKAQTPTPTPTDSDFDLMQRAQMIAEIKQLRATNAGLTTQVTELKTQVSIYVQLNTVQEARIGDLKEAIKARTDAGNISDKVEGLYKSQIVDYKTEVDRLRAENDGLRKSRDRRSLIMGIVGVAAGAFLFH